jgi:hypothetical protein
VLLREGRLRLPPDLPWAAEGLLPA